MPTELRLDKPGRGGRLPLGQFLFAYLRSLGVRHCFGLPGDYVLPLFKALEDTPGIEPVVATHEPCAAFSADAYGRLTGLGVLLVTYGVGGFNAMNGVAGAHAESSPLLVISGGPPLGSRPPDPLLAPAAHHFVKHLSSQLEAYRHITDLALRIESREAAAATIEQAASHALRVKRPVYLEIPTDLMTSETAVGTDSPPGAGLAPAAEAPRSAGTELGDGGPGSRSTGPELLEQAVSLFLERIHAARDPVLYVGAEIGRYGLQPQVRRIMAARHAPVATSILGKGILNETEPGVLGVYAGVLSQTPTVRTLVEKADLVVTLGVKVTDVNCGAFTANLARDRILIAQSGWLGDGLQRFARDVPFAPFVRRLAERIAPLDGPPAWPQVGPTHVSEGRTLMDRYLAVVNAHLDEQHVVVADTGDACYGSLFLTTQRDNGYLAPTFYNTMGFAVPAALGVQLADPGCRPVVLVGDGAFQMTGMEFSNLVAWGLNPIVILFNNCGFGMQRLFVDGAFNDIQPWDYGRIIDLVGGGRAWRVTNAGEMQDALRASLAFTGGPSLIEAIVDKGEVSTGLDLLGQALQREKTGVCPLNEGDVPCRHEDQCAFCRAAIWQ